MGLRLCAGRNMTNEKADLRAVVTMREDETLMVEVSFVIKKVVGCPDGAALRLTYTDPDAACQLVDLLVKGTNLEVFHFDN